MYGVHSLCIFSKITYKVLKFQHNLCIFKLESIIKILTLLGINITNKRQYKIIRSHFDEKKTI